MAAGEPGDEGPQFYVCCEQGVLLESKTVKDSIIDLIAIYRYFVFDITYPKSHSAILLFFNIMFLTLRTARLYQWPLQNLLATFTSISCVICIPDVIHNSSHCIGFCSCL